jgi:2-oxo-4-hydroxy-4-carboxy--5-ureidoimidazoline (OHCU) decarboxylase
VPDPADASGDAWTLDRLDDAACLAVLSPLFEGAPRFLSRLVAARPFGNPHALFARARAIAHAMPEAEQLELIDAHPRLGAPASSVSAFSYVEQGFGFDAAEVAAAAERMRLAVHLERLNDAYEARFGFRYCVFVAGRPREALLPGMEAALAADREDEITRALNAIVDIAADRYARPDD